MLLSKVESYTVKNPIDKKSEIGDLWDLAMGAVPDWVVAICTLITTALVVREQLRRRQAEIKKT